MPLPVRAQVIAQQLPDLMAMFKHTSSVVGSAQFGVPRLSQQHMPRTLPREAVWVDDSTLAVLGRKSANQVIRPWFVPLGGPITAGPGLAGAVAITTVSGERQLVVTTDGGDVYIRAGNNWQSVGKGSGFLVAAR